MYVDLKRCIGCNACSVACRQEFFGNMDVGRLQMPIGQVWTQIYGAEKEDYPSVDVQVLPMRCQQCGDAPCVAKCTSLGYNALKRRPDGIVWVDDKLCRGVNCQQCIPVCPYRAMTMNPYRTNTSTDPKFTRQGVAEKCNFCFHRTDKGLAPACVITCLGVTLDYGEFNALRAKYPNAETMGEVKPRFLFGNLGDEPKHRTSGYPDPVPFHDD
jgi:Fe-S-cluster-containing dehydrogenase component